MAIVTIPGAPGVSECTQVLEDVLRTAKNRRIVQVAIATVEFADDGTLQTRAYWCAPQRMQDHLIESLRLAHGGLKDLYEQVTLKDRDPSVGADHVVWNVQLGPRSFDFIPWLVTQEMARIRAGAPTPLKVHFWRGRDGNVPIHPFMDKVFRPALDLIGAIEDKEDSGGQSSEIFTLRDVSEAARSGEKTPVFRAPEYAREAVAQKLCGSSPVTITLRERVNWINRNSNIEAWMRFADYLTAQGHSVVFVRDTTKSHEPLWHRTIEYPTYPEASTDLHIRAALYEAASVNLFVGNGPASLAWFSERPWLMFIPVVRNDDQYWANTPAFWKEMQGVEQGEQYPWSRQDQRIVWGQDTFETIRDAWDALAPRLSAAA